MRRLLCQCKSLVRCNRCNGSRGGTGFCSPIARSRRRAWVSRRAPVWPIGTAIRDLEGGGRWEVPWSVPDCRAHADDPSRTCVSWTQALGAAGLLQVSSSAAHQDAIAEWPAPAEWRRGEYQFTISSQAHACGMPYGQPRTRSVGFGGAPDS
jgi:hypothetical protein